MPITPEILHRVCRAAVAAQHTTVLATPILTFPHSPRHFHPFFTTRPSPRTQPNSPSTRPPPAIFQPGGLVRSPQGIEQTLAVDFYAHVSLTFGLMEELKKGAAGRGGARIVLQVRRASCVLCVACRVCACCKGWRVLMHGLWPVQLWVVTHTCTHRQTDTDTHTHTHADTHSVVHMHARVQHTHRPARLSSSRRTTPTTSRCGGGVGGGWGC